MKKYFLIFFLIPSAILCGPRQTLLQQVKAIAASRYGTQGFTAENNKCGFNDIGRILMNRQSLSPVEAALMKQLSDRPQMQKSLVSPGGYFRIHYDTTGLDAPSLIAQSQNGYTLLPGTSDAYADSVAAIFDYVWQREVIGMGYPPPPSDAGLGGDNAYDVYIEESTDYGLTTPDDPTATTSSSFISIDNDFIEPGFYSKGLAAVMVTAAHEFFHAIQIGNYRMYGLNETPFFFEISSVWMEDEVYPEVKDYLLYLGGVAGSFTNTALPLNETNGFVEYGRTVFAKYISKQYGTGIMKDIWTAAGSMPTLPAIVQTLQGYHTSLEAEYPEYALWYFYTGPRADPEQYFPDGALYPDVKIYDRITFIPPVSQSAYTSRDLAFQYYQVINSDTATMLATNVNVDAALAGSSQPYPFSYTVRNDNSGGGTILANGWSILFQANDPENWKSIVIYNSKPPVDTDINPFPNPFIADGLSLVAFPVPSSAASADLAVYSSDLREVYHRRLESRNKLGKTIIQWNGSMDNGIPAPSGVYWYTLKAGSTKHQGKIAILKK